MASAADTGSVGGRLRGQQPLRTGGHLRPERQRAQGGHPLRAVHLLPRLRPRRRLASMLARRGARRRAARAGREQHVPTPDVAQRWQVQRLHPQARRRRGLDGRGIRAFPAVVGRVVGRSHRIAGRQDAHPRGRHGDSHRAVLGARRRVERGQAPRSRGRRCGLPRQPRAGVAWLRPDLRIGQGECAGAVQRHARTDADAGHRPPQRHLAASRQRAGGPLPRVRLERQAAGQLRGACGGHPVCRRRAVDDTRRGPCDVQPAQDSGRGRANRPAQRGRGRSRIAARHRPDHRPTLAASPDQGVRLRRVQGPRRPPAQGARHRRGAARGGRRAGKVLRAAGQERAAEDRGQQGQGREGRR